MSPSDPPPADAERIVYDLLEAVAAARGEDVTALKPISEVTDPEALERFLASTSVPVTVRLAVYGCEVELEGDGSVTVVSDDA